MFPKKILISVNILLVVLLYVPIDAQVRDDGFEQWKRKEQEEYQEYRKEVTTEYDAYMEKERKAFEEFKREVMQKWDEFRASTDTEWVDYDSDLEARSSVDFEKGAVVVEAIVPKAEGADADDVKRQLVEKVEDKIEKLVRSKTTNKDFAGHGDAQEAVPEAEVLPTPVLAGQLKTVEGEEVKSGNAGQFAREIVETRPVEITAVESGDGVERVKVKVTFPLIPEHLKIRASKFREEVDRHAARFSMDNRLVFAVMHTESYFNPKARSHVPAFGLMQLVPSSGARDAYLYVHKKDRLVDGNYLYNPENNILLGTAYLNKLGTVYFKEISDPEKVLYCSICAYNTGPGNVARAIYGGTKLGTAAQHANEMTDEQLYNKLLSDLPHGETKDYLEKVHSRIEIYGEWRNQPESP